MAASNSLDSIVTIKGWPPGFSIFGVTSTIVRFPGCVDQPPVTRVSPCDKFDRSEAVKVRTPEIAPNSLGGGRSDGDVVVKLTGIHTLTAAAAATVATGLFGEA